jgi:hypothetical protein
MGALPKEYCRAVDAENLPQQQEELPEHSFSVERVGEDAGKIAQNAQRLSRRGGRPHLDRLHGLHRQRRRCRLNWTGGGGRQPKPIQQGGEHAPAHRPSQHVGNALQVGFFLPLRLLGAGVDDNRAPGRFAAQLLQEPNLPDAGQFNVNDAGLSQAMLEQRLRLIQAGASDDAVMLRINSSANRFGEIRMLGQYQ